jgi:hypothetical protein
MILYVTECFYSQPLPFLDSQITSENEESVSYSARHAKIEDPYGWTSTHDQYSWLMIDFLQRTTMTAIRVRGSPVFNIWSPTFTIEYSNNEYTFETFKEHGSTKVSKIII